jgi:hypothetical protein
MNREVFIPFTYMGQFSRRKGWKTKPTETLVFYTRGTPYRIRRLMVGVIGCVPAEVERLQKTYTISFQQGEWSVSFTLAELCGFSFGYILFPEHELPRLSKFTISLKGEPFKTQGVRVTLAIMGVKVYHIKKPRKLNGGKVA